jgi:tight adherence protein B
MADIADYKPNQEKEKSKQIKETLVNLFHRSGNLVQSLKTSNRFDVMMQQADWPITGPEFQIILLGLGIIFALFFYLLTLQLLNAVLGLVFGALIGWMTLRIRIQRRQAAFSNQISDMLKMVSDAMRAGFSFMQALEHIANEMDAPVSREVQKVMRETNLRVPLETALENMSQRVQSKDFDLVITAVLIQRQVGGNLSQILDTISDTVNDRLRMRQEIKTLTAQGRLSGVILALLPVALAFLLNVLNPEYLRPLFDEEIGHLAIGAAIILEIIGFLVIKRIVNIDI